MVEGARRPRGHDRPRRGRQGRARLDPRGRVAVGRRRDEGDLRPRAARGRAAGDRAPEPLRDLLHQPGRPGARARRGHGPGLRRLPGRVPHQHRGRRPVSRRSATVGDRLVDFHVADTNRLACGMGHWDWERVVGTLREVGYDGALTVEFVAPVDRTPANPFPNAIETSPVDISDEQRKFIEDHGSDLLSEEFYDWLVEGCAKTLLPLIQQAEGLSHDAHRDEHVDVHLPALRGHAAGARRGARPRGRAGLRRRGGGVVRAAPGGRRPERPGAAQRLPPRVRRARPRAGRRGRELRRLPQHPHQRRQLRLPGRPGPAARPLRRPRHRHAPAGHHRPAGGDGRARPRRRLRAARDDVARGRPAGRRPRRSASAGSSSRAPRSTSRARSSASPRT